MNPRIRLLMGVLSLILCLTVVHSSQTESLTPEELQKLSKNYPGCQTWQGHECVQCSYRFYFDMNGICRMVSDHCRTFNRDMGFCQTCYEGYDLKDGMCELRDLLAPQNIGCRTWQDNICQQCSFRYYFDDERVCRQVSDFCRTWDGEGLCLTCYGGYTLKDGACVLDASRLPGGMQNLCAKFDENVCVQCAFRSYLNDQGVCTQVDSYCKTWDEKDGMCLTCYRGYDLMNGKCNWSTENVGPPPDTGCRQWDWDELVCYQCALGYAEQDGACVRIYKEDGTGLTNDVHCRKIQEGQCVQCSFRYFLNEQNVCLKVDDLCQEWSDEGWCTSCYRGYYLNQGKCLILSQAERPTEGISGGSTIGEMSAGMAGGMDYGMTVVNQQTTTSTNQNESGVKIPLVVDGKNTLQGCHKIGDNNLCLECSFRFYFDQNKICRQVSDFCATWNEQGRCESCYLGYYLNQGRCLIDSDNTKSEYPLCKVYNQAKGACSQCEDRAYFVEEGVCAAVHQNCKTWDEEEGFCLTCFGGYDLEDKECVWATSIIPAPNMGCANWDWEALKCNMCMKDYVKVDNLCVSVYDRCLISDGDKCTSCSLGFRPNEQGKCMLGNPLCKVGDGQGGCRSCYSGFLVINQQCIPISKLAQIQIFYTSLELIQL